MLCCNLKNLFIFHVTDVGRLFMFSFSYLLFCSASIFILLISSVSLLLYVQDSLFQCENDRVEGVDFYKRSQQLCVLLVQDYTLYIYLLVFANLEFLCYFRSNYYCLLPCNVLNLITFFS